MKAPHKKLNTRWSKTGQRYDSKTQDVIDKKYHEAFGWRHGAKVRRPT
jgi:hypothetical protein